MTKEELIESSDLNREDNIKYISSEAQGIAIALDSDRYAPTLCKLERAYICGRRKSEKQIQIDAEQIRALQKQNGELTDELTLTNNECKKMREELKQRIRENQKLCEQIEKMQETLKSDLIARLKEQMQYSTSPSCTKGMELFIKSIEKWEIKENDN